MSIVLPPGVWRPEPEPFEPYDHELAAAFDVLEKLNQRAHEKSHNYNAFEREIKERFEDIGLIVKVAWRNYAMNRVVQVGSAMPEVTLVGRIEKAPFDHDRQVHEVTHNVLDLPEEDAGVIKTDAGESFRRLRERDHGPAH